MNFRYEFAKRHHDKRYKTKCPRCHTKNAFNLYFDNENQTLAPEEYGKCDRINTCGYINRPESSQPILENPKPRVVLPTSYISKEEVLSLGLERYKDPLSIWLIEKFGDVAKRVLQDYAVFSVFVKAWNEYVPLFLLVDEQGRIRSGKMMRYELQNGEPKRTKYEEYYDNIKWLHVGKGKENFVYEQIAFGSHILPLYPDKDVMLVESEKTALILASVRPQYNWLAVLSWAGFQPHLLPNLKNKSVQAFPDKGEKVYTYWKEKCEEFLQEGLVLNAECSIFVEQSSLGEGKDLGDYVIQKLKK